MWSFMVVVIAPFIDFIPCFLKCPEPVLIKAFIPKLSIQALNECILCRLSWLNKVFGTTSVTAGLISWIANWSVFVNGTIGLLSRPNKSAPVLLSLRLKLSGGLWL